MLQHRKMWYENSKICYFLEHTFTYTNQIGPMAYTINYKIQ